MLEAPVFLKVVALCCMVALVYAGALRRLAAVTQPLRLELAGLGESVLASEPAAERRKQIDFYLRYAFSGWVMVVAVPVFPLILIATAFSRGKGHTSGSAEDDRLALLFTISAVAANPIFGLVFLAELIVFGIGMFFIGGVSAVRAVFFALIRAEIAIPAYAPRLAYTNGR